MKPNNSHELLAEEFSSFSMNKILTIRKTLDDFKILDPDLESMHI